MEVIHALHAGICDRVVHYLLAGTSVDLVGVHGSGRTSLLQDASVWLADSGVQTVRVDGIAVLDGRPLEALAVAGLVSGQSVRSAATAVSGAAQSLAAELGARRAALVVDDETDLDDASVGAVVSARRSVPAPVLSASLPGADPIVRARWSAGIQPAVTLDVPSLGYVDTQTLMTSRLGGPVAAEVVSRTFAASGGLPGVVCATVAGAVENGSLTLRDGIWVAGPDLWSRDVENAVERLLGEVSPAALEGLHALALAGPVDIHTARRLVSWESLEELDGRRLLRFLPQGGDVVVSVFPLVVAERFQRQGVSARHLRVDEHVTVALGGPDAARRASTPPLWQPAAASLVEGLQADELRGAGTIVSRMLQEHWHREALLRRAEWERTPSPRAATALLRALIVTGATAQDIHAVREATTRSGDRRELATFDAWWALYAGAVKHDGDQVHQALSTTRADADEYILLVDAVEAYATTLADHAVDPDSLEVPLDASRDDVELASVMRAELLLIQGRSAEAIAVMDALGRPSTPLARAGAVAHGYALILEGDPDGALEWAENALVAAWQRYDVDAIIGSTYVTALALLTRERTPALRAHLGATLSTGLLSILRRPHQVALMSVAAELAIEDGRQQTARTLAEQARALETRAGPVLLGSPTRALAHLDAEHLRHSQAPRLVAQRLWDEAIDMLDRGYLAPGYISGVLALLEEPTPERAETLRTTSSRLPAPLFRLLERAVDAAADEDVEKLVGTADFLVDAEQEYFASRLYGLALRRLYAARRPDRAATLRSAAQARLEASGAYDPTLGAGTLSGRSGLTRREAEVVTLATSGLTNKEIATRLVVSVRTVENHLHRAFRKLGADGRAEARAILGTQRRTRPAQKPGSTTRP